MGNVACMGEPRNLVGKHDGKRPLERPGLRLKDIIKTCLMEIDREDVDWIGFRVGKGGVLL